MRTVILCARQRPVGGGTPAPLRVPAESLHWLVAPGKPPGLFLGLVGLGPPAQRFERLGTAGVRPAEQGAIFGRYRLECFVELGQSGRGVVAFEQRFAEPEAGFT